MIRKGAVYKFDDEQKMAYALLEDQWVGYANPESMKAKVKLSQIYWYDVLKATQNA